MEEPISNMKRKLFALLVLLALFAAAAAAGAETLPPEVPGETAGEPGSGEPAAAEGDETLPLATPTDLCAHEHTRTVRYFDSPMYTPLNAEYHIVSGTALEEVLCLDCGESLSAEKVSYVEEIHPHLNRKGRCVFCGREEEAPEIPAEAQEVVLLLAGAEDQPDRFVCTLTEMDLADAGDILVLRPEGRDAALVLQAEPFRKEIRSTGGTLTAEINSEQGLAVNASVRLYDADGRETEPDKRNISLRIYGEESKKPLAVTYNPPAGEGKPTEQQASWVPGSGEKEGYWQAAWQGSGEYRYGAEGRK